jgi:hypothetical protein
MSFGRLISENFKTVVGMFTGAVIAGQAVISQPEPKRGFFYNVGAVVKADVTAVAEGAGLAPLPDLDINIDPRQIGYMLGQEVESQRAGYEQGRADRAATLAIEKKAHVACTYEARKPKNELEFKMTGQSDAFDKAHAGQPVSPAVAIGERRQRFIEGCTADRTATELSRRGLLSSPFLGQE